MDQRKAMDNPFWPNSSAVAKAKDASANLPLPAVSGAEWILSEHDIDCITAGAGILASGGGGDPNIGKMSAMRVLKDGIEIKITNPCRLDAEKMGLVCTVAMMGDPEALKEAESTDGSLLALSRVQEVMAGGGQFKVTEITCEDKTTFPAYVAIAKDLQKVSVDNVPLSKRITGLTAVETGGINTIEPLKVSAYNGLPCLDVAGQGRSYPKLEMYMPFIYGCNYCPASLADSKKETVTCVGVGSCEEMEIFFRNATVKMGDLASIAMGIIPFETIFTKMVLFATSRAWQLGRAVHRAIKTNSSVLSTIVEQQHGLVLITGNVASFKPEKRDGFSETVCVVEGLEEYAGNFVKISALNENFVAEKVKSIEDEEVLETLATTPDLITVVNLETSNPLDVAVMAYKDCRGLNVAVVILPANPLLYTPQALKVVGPRALGLDVDYSQPRLLKTK